MDVKSMQLQLCLDATPGHLSTSIYNYTLRTSLSTSAPPVSVCCLHSWASFMCFPE